MPRDVLESRASVALSPASFRQKIFQFSSKSAEKGFCQLPPLLAGCRAPLGHGTPWHRQLHSPHLLRHPLSPGSISSVTLTCPAHAGLLLQPWSLGNAVSAPCVPPGASRCSGAALGEPSASLDGQADGTVLGCQWCLWQQRGEEMLWAACKTPAERGLNSSCAHQWQQRLI